MTPNFDRMARRGTDVHYTFTCQPVCGPARSCLQTGMYATNTGVFHNGVALDQGRGDYGQESRRVGYTTGYRQVASGLTEPVPRKNGGANIGSRPTRWNSRRRLRHDHV
ncbi:MAG: sulfatase-like hydrolase/transferase [Caldilineaceae bacterium]